MRVSQGELKSKIVHRSRCEAPQFFRKEKILVKQEQHDGGAACVAGNG